MHLWIVNNQTPFAVGKAFVRDREAREMWIVAVRASFGIKRDGTLWLLEEQQAVSRTPHFRGDPAVSSLLYESDFPFTKVATDVIVEGHAWAPRGRPVAAVDLSLQIGRILKRLRVHGDRVWMRTTEPGVLRPSDAQPFVKMPIVYERAWGGVEAGSASGWAWNPVGLGLSSESSALLERAVPNIEEPRAPIKTSASRPMRPAGLGAIAAHWNPRLSFAGTYDARWERERAPLWPEDFDSRFFQVAPEDQQASGFMQGGERCELHQLTADGTLRFNLPRLRIIARTYFTDCEVQRTADLHLVLIEPDLPRVQLVWQAAFECHGREHELRSTTVRCEGEPVCRSR